MGVLLFIFLIAFILSTVARISREVEQQRRNDGSVVPKKVVIEEVAKWCPPHKWFYQEVKDTEGNTVRHRIVCELCGPLKPSNGPARSE